MDAFELLSEIGPSAIIVTGYEEESFLRFRKQAMENLVVELFGRAFLVKNICSRSLPIDGAWHPGSLEYLVELQEVFGL